MNSHELDYCGWTHAEDPLPQYDSMDSLREDMKRIHDALGDKKKVDIYEVSGILNSHPTM